MKKDLKKAELRLLYHQPKGKITNLDLPPLRYLMIDGQGDPGTSPWYAQAVEALFSVSYTVKFALKKATGHPALDYAVMPLEGLWWADDWSAFVADDRAEWRWTMMILQPDFVPENLVHDAIETVFQKKRIEAVRSLRLEMLTEGCCCQILHIGPFSTEKTTVEALHRHLDDLGSPTGKHHEIYLSDVRRAEPSRWKTIIRQPVTPANSERKSLFLAAKIQLG